MLSGIHHSTLKTLDRFEIIEELGRGSQGIVYLARDPQLERNVAIKTFHENSDFKAAKQQLLKEARSISRLQHPNILTLFESNEADGQTYLVFEYIDGASLNKFLSFKGKLSVDLALEIMIPVLDAVNYAHERGIIHRDLTPSNIIISGNNKPKLMDFGIADLLGRSQTDDAISGSLHYMSPEQCENKPPLPVSDIFSLGLILLELLTGKRAITADNHFAIINQIVNESIDVPETITPVVREVILKALKKAPEERYENANEMKLALANHLTEIRPEITEADHNDKDSTLQFLLRRMRHKKDFPVMPQQISEIANSTNDRSDASANMLANKILRNYSLSTKLLRLVNSPVYGQYGGRISTVSRAVVILGFKEVRMAAMGLMLFDHLQNDNQSKMIKEASLSSMMSGSLARELGSELNIEDTEESYICSMFHKFGRLLTMFYFAEEANIIESNIQRKKIKEGQASAEVLGLSYEELGIGVAKAWHLPMPIMRSMKNIEGTEINPAEDEEDKNMQLANFSNSLCSIIQNDSTDTIEVSIKSLLDKYSNSIDLTSKQLNVFISKAVDHVHEYANIFNLKVNESSFIQNIESWISGEPTTTDEENTHSKLKKDDDESPPTSDSSRRAMDLLNGVQEISDSIIDGASLNDAMIMVIETLYSGFNFNRVMFCMINRKDATVDARFGFGQDIDELLKTFRVPIRREIDIFNLSLTKHQDFIIDNIDAPDIKDMIPGWYREKMHSKSMIIYPIVINKVPMGFIYADNSVPTQLSKHEQISVIKTLRNQIILAIRQNSN